MFTQLNTLKHLIQKKLCSATFKGGLWILASRLGRNVLQGVYFFLIARALGAEQYGTFIGVAALAKILLPFATWGAAEILMKHVSRTPEQFSTYWGNALTMIGIFGSACLLLMFGLSEVLLSPAATLQLMLCLGLADLIFSRFVDCAMMAFMAMDMPQLNAQLHILLTVNSVIAAFCLWTFVPEPNVMAWGWLYLASRVVTAVIALFLVQRLLGQPKAVLRWIVPELSQGFYFAVGFSAYTLSNDLDKTMLARLGTLKATGIYGAAYRVIDVALAPIMSLAAVAYAKFFRAGVSGVQGSMQVAKRFVPVAGAYGLMASFAVCLAAPIVPLLLGADYTEVVSAIRWLSPLLFLRSIQNFAADTLTGAGLQGTRTLLQVGVALLNGVGNFFLIPLYSWKGAAWASLISDSILVGGLWLLVFGFYRQQVSQQQTASN